MSETKSYMFCNGKGGVGKSTLTVNVTMGVQRAIRNTVALLDCDNQKTATNWVSRLPDSGIKLVDTFKVEEKHLFIDTASRSELETHIRDLPRPNLYLIPTTATIGDQEISQATVKLIKKYRPEANVYLIFNMLKRGAADCCYQDKNDRWVIDSKKLDLYAESIGCPRLKNVIMERKCYAYAQIGGWKDLTTEAKIEILKLAIEIIKL